MNIPGPEHRQLCDADADKLVQQLYDTYGDKTARQIYLNLIHTFSEIDIEALPTEIIEFHKANQAKIKIKHPEKIEKAAEFFQHYGHSMFLVLITKSLPQIYSNYRGVKVLYETGYLLGKDNDALVARRLMETAQFFIDIMSKGSFDHNQYGFFAATKVRIIHAYARKFMWDRDWNNKFAPTYDQPVCQEDMTLTLLAFSVCNIEGIRKMGLVVTDEDADAIVYIWHIAGQLLGVLDKFNPDNFEDGQQLFHHILNKEKKIGMENKALVDAILNFMRTIFSPSFIVNTPLRKQNKLPEVLVSYLVGKEISPYIGLNYYSDTYYKHVLKGVDLLLPNLFINSRKNKVAESIVSDNFAKIIAGIFTFIKDSYKMEFRIQQSILTDWKINKYLKDYGIHTPSA